MKPKSVAPQSRVMAVDRKPVSYTHLAKIVHFGSVSLTADPARTATLDAAARAKKLGAIITLSLIHISLLMKEKRREYPITGSVQTVPR